MAREMESAVATAAVAEVVRVITMLKLEYDSGTVATHSGVGTITYDGDEYLGNAGLAEISEIQEDSELTAAGVKVALSGVDTTNISTALNENYQGRRATIFLALLDSDDQIIDDPVVIFRGRMDTAKITIGAQGKLEQEIQNAMADWERPRVRRYNNPDQQAKYPGDKGMEFVEQAVEKEIFWGNDKPPVRNV